MSASTTPTEPRAPAPFPPSVGGSALSLVAGMLLARPLMDALVIGADLPLRAWGVPVGMLAFVVVLLQLSLEARRRIAGEPDPASVRRQWWVIGGAFVLGLGGGIAFSMLGPGGA